MAKPSKETTEQAERKLDAALEVVRRHAQVLELSRAYGRVELIFVGGRVTAVRLLQEEPIS